MADARTRSDDPPSLRVVRGELELALRVTDPDVVAELESVPEGAAREAHALKALRIGVTALQGARGQVDAAVVRKEGERLVAELRRSLDAHREGLGGRLETTLKEWFDPQSGKLPERIRGLVKKDGELETVLQRAVGSDGSALVATLRTHVGPESPLMKVLSPSQSEGLLHSLGQAVEKQLATQREHILQQFSLDRSDSALSRLVQELEKKHGDLTTELKGRIDHVVREFSMDEEGSALKRLVDRVDQAQKRITREFTLDEEASALGNLRKQLLDVLHEHEKRNVAFQQMVVEQLGRMQGAKEEEQRSTRHGLTFEQALFERVQAYAQGAGDVASFTGNETGLVRNDKKGDVVIQLGPDAVAAGARIVLEAKQDQSYSMRHAAEEIAAARNNRGAEVGVFVFSKRSAPEGLKVLQRMGSDVFVVWDAEDESSDTALEAALLLAKALVTRAATEKDEEAVDPERFERAILDIEKHANNLDDVTKAAETIRSGADRILTRVRIDQDAFRRQIEELRRLLDALRDA
ncbi:MAG: hypothetical protein H6826_03450 [Planctomycetes bacterium]|nr:hypothetical protein [Planctomycetota bacterium]MCB9824390.1 hypothetical protein [Planctomycetota bacterium]MCB9900387.1 hypothetical protein [Planctomycetota bacterium]